MLTANSIPASPSAAARAATAGSRAPPPQRSPCPSGSIRASVALELEHEPADALVGDQQVRARPDHVRRSSPRSRAHVEQLDQLAPRAGAREVLGGAAGAHRRQPRQRVVGEGSTIVSGSATSSRPSASTSPAPITTTSVAGARRARSMTRGGRRAVGQPVGRLARRRVDRRLGDQQAADAGKVRRPARAPDRRRARRPRRRRRAPRRTRGRAPRVREYRCGWKTAIRRAGSSVRAAASVAAISVGWWA